MFVSNSAIEDGYLINNSLRLRASASAYLSRTPGSTTNQKTITLSALVKRGSLGALQDILTAGSASSNFFYFGFNSSDQLVLQCATGSTDVARFTTSAVRRDPSAWYHIVLSIDMTQASSTNGMRLWVNGEQQTLSVVAYAQNSSLNINASGVTHYIGRASLSAAEYFDGYLSEINFIDGQALTPSSFGEFDSVVTNRWKPKKYTGTYGTNGFYLPFSNGTSLTTLGADASGNSNNWTLNNISLTAGVTYDWMLDSPTNNYATWNPLDCFSAGGVTLGSANLNVTLDRTTFNCWARSGIAIPSSGKWYFEVPLISASGVGGGTVYITAGVGAVDMKRSSQSTDADSLNFFRTANSFDGTRLSNSGAGYVSSAYGVQVTASNVMRVAVDMDNGRLFVGGPAGWHNSGDPVAGTNAAHTDLVSTGKTWMPYVGAVGNTSNTVAINHGQRPFAYTPPTGFKALCTSNLPTPTGAAANPRKHFGVVTYTGTGAARSVTGVGFQPDFVWTKNRSVSSSHGLLDAIRGAGKFLYSESTSAEQTFATDFLSFDTDGFSLGSGSGSVTNGNGNAMVAWNWKAGGAAVTNTAGSITSQVSANTDAGFSIVTYTGTGANATVGHGLGAAPKMVIVKRRNSTGDWPVWVQPVAATGSDRVLFLNAADAQTAAGTNFNSSSPTSTVINVGTNAATNGSGGTYVAYVFAEIPGYSKFGSYTGNGSADGPFVYCGFRPRYVLIKRTDTAGFGWHTWDTARQPSNQMQAVLFANTSGAEATPYFLDVLSNGFKLRGSGVSTNASGGTYIFAAFADLPFQFANAR